MIAVYIVIGFIAGLVVSFIVISELKKRQRSEIEALKEAEEKIVSGLKDQLESERKQSRELREESDKQWDLKFKRLKEEMQSQVVSQLEAKRNTLRDANREQISELLEPIKEQFDRFRKSMEESRTAGEVAKKELKDSFESTMKLFRMQQDQAVTALRQETARIGNEADNLTRALKRDTKKQGDWGEMILESLLENSGLEKDIHYFVQENIKDEERKNLRPDVIVKFPEGRSIIIDSKVSLTAYVEAFETEDEDVRIRRLKDHARSVKRHVDELAEKKYDKVVSDAIGFVLMFIPNDSCYLAALDEDRNLGKYAYSKGIVIISPSNLMIALQLAYNMWQQDVRNKNIDNIVKTAADLYDKVALYTETMEKVGTQIDTLRDTFDKAKNQLYEGKSNIVRRIENLKNLGITPRKQIKGLDE